MALLTVGAQYRYAGNPNGNVEGQLGDQCKDTTTSGALYTCVTPGNIITTVWQLIGGGAGITYTPLNNTIVIDNMAHTIGGGYTAGTNITITGNVIAATGGSTTVVQATNNTILVTNPTTGVYSVAADYIAGTGITITGNTIGTVFNNNLVKSYPPLKVLVGGDSVPGVNAGFTDTVIYGENVAPGLTTSATKNVLIGTDAATLFTTQVWNVGIGCNTLSNSTGSYNTAVGGNTLSVDTAGLNTAIGYNAGAAKITGGQNVIIGYNAGATQASYAACTFIGGTADGTVNLLDNSTAIGSNTQISVNNAMNLGNNANVGINNPSPQYTLDISPVNGTSALALYPNTNPVVPAGGRNLLWVDNNNNLQYSGNGSANFQLTNPSYCRLGQWFSTSGANIPVVQNYWASYVINGKFVVYILPGFASSLNQPTKFLFKQPDNSDWPYSAIPAPVSWTLFVINNNVTQYGNVTISNTNGQQIIVTADQNGSTFQGSCNIPPVTIVVAL